MTAPFLLDEMSEESTCLVGPFHICRAANNGRICFLISRSDAAQNANVSLIDAVRIHDLRIMVAHRFRSPQKRTVMLD
jgi:hypothetical protein